ncbi:YdeI/OmpD-associated family protein [Bremerella sp. T1]|uniref:YdeI/OmpD-associated family protein n=1 Tax=Bremerella sp. TYQ1 TaxID=3119568 RepID=UPI001CCCCA70|nr:YdeI/OmpD-associated family protein [Bremerella volcania]UBM36653.1 YdeI/OmpD-associated family protein [Bremerella volcania]
MNSNVDQYIADHPQWKSELTALRKILLASELTEDWKWRAPCYTLDGKNVAMLAAFKNDCVLSFFKGALLKDPEGILVKPGENSQSARVVRFTSNTQVKERKSALQMYLAEAAENERSGKQVATSNKADPYPAELTAKLDEDPQLKTAFEALTPGRQRAYVMFFSAAKQSKTRTTRIEKFVPRILDGKGMNDCVCGLTKKPPGCDGSHNQAK